MRNAASSAINALAAKFGQVSISPRSTTPPPAPKVAATPVVSKVGVSALQTEVGAVSTAAGRGRAVAMCQPMPQVGAPVASRPQSAAPKAVPAATKAAGVAAHPPSAPQRQFVAPAKPVVPAAAAAAPRLQPSYASASSAVATSTAAGVVGNQGVLFAKAPKLQIKSPSRKEAEAIVAECRKAGMSNDAIRAHVTESVRDEVIDDTFVRLAAKDGPVLTEAARCSSIEAQVSQSSHPTKTQQSLGVVVPVPDQEMDDRGNITYTGKAIGINPEYCQKNYPKRDLEDRIKALQGPFKKCYIMCLQEMARIHWSKPGESTFAKKKAYFDVTQILQFMEPYAKTDYSKSKIVQSYLLDVILQIARKYRTFDKMFK